MAILNNLIVIILRNQMQTKENAEDIVFNVPRFGS